MIFGGEMYAPAVLLVVSQPSDFTHERLRVGWGKTLVAQEYSDRFRAYRKNIHAILGSKAAVSRFNQLQDVEVRRFLLRTLEEPDKVLHHVRTYVTCPCSSRNCII